MVKGPQEEQELIEAQEKKIHNLTQLVSAYAAELEGCRKLILGEKRGSSQQAKSDQPFSFQNMRRAAIGLMLVWYWRKVVTQCFHQRFPDALERHTIHLSCEAMSPCRFLRSKLEALPIAPGSSVEATK